MPDLLSLVGLKCPRCDYELTGLTVHRCPECGTPFDLAEITPKPPTLPFETAIQARLIPAFLRTWILALALPWRFARHALRGLSIKRASMFCLICFAIPAVKIVVIWQAQFLVPWWGAALAYLIAQTLWLTALDFRHWRRMVASALFWAAVGGYASAVVVTEFWSGPPLLFAGVYFRLFINETPSSLIDLLPMGGDSPHGRFIAILQLAAALLMPTACLWVRLRSRGAGRLESALLAFLGFVGLYILYGLAIEQVGDPLDGWVYPNRFSLATPASNPTGL